jgi:uncharacterized protein YlxW (UPF0749 family)
VTPDAEASPDPADGPDSPGLRRLREALFRPSRAQVVVGVLLAALGFAAITQVRTNTNDNSYAGYREQDLVNVLSALAGTSQRAQQEINQLEARRRQLESSQQAQSAALAAAQKQAQELAILAGAVPVTGPGIRVTVTSTSTPCSTPSRSSGRPAPRRCRSTARCGWWPRARCSRPRRASRSTGSS